MAYSDLDSVRQHRERALKYIATGVSELLDRELGISDWECGSPIEAIFKLWWLAIETVYPWRTRVLDLEAQHVHVINGHSYRLDFSVTPADKNGWYEAHKRGIKYQGIGVELDGHDFHERTKEQVASRNQRDRDFQADGWKILHFSGSALFADPLATVLAVSDAGLSALFTMSAKLRAQQLTAK